MKTATLECSANGVAFGTNLRAFHRFRRRSRSIFILGLILSTVAVHGSAARGDGPQGVYQDGYEYQTNAIREDSKDEKLYIGRSGDPWGLSFSTSHQENENAYARVSPANFTLNSTRESSSGNENFIRTRFKRGVVHLYNMVVCATGCNPLAYKGYGCYCGFLGSGYVIDGIDKCCKMHDWCYHATGCPMFMEYFVPYYWKCYHGYQPICAVEHGNWGASGSCAQRLCECDRSLAECLRRYPCPTTKAVCTSSPWRLVQNLFMVM